MKRLGVFVFALVLSCSLYSQSVGLVFSGGGAKCLAQIGVLKALEEHDIPIDYITGTSGGAIVGGLYASGYSVDDIIDIFASGVMDKYLKTSEECTAGYYAMEEPENATWFNAKFNLKPKFSYEVIRPSLLISSNINFGMMQFFAQASTACNNNFDSLMVKFRCVATSVNDNRPYVFRDGDLATAIRSSMAFPFVFEPVSYKGMVLLDGGMYDNFPMNVMVEDFNPDVIIGCLVSDNFPDAKADDIISVVQNVFMVDMDKDMPENSIIIEPAVLNIGLLEFDEVEQLVDSGYNACMEHIDEIVKRVNRRQTEVQRRERRNIFNYKKPPLFFYDIVADSLTEKQQEYAEVMIDRKKTILTAKEVDKNYSVLLADDVIESIIPQAVYSPDVNQYYLNLDIKEKKHFQAGFGGNMSVGGPSQACFNFKIRDFNRYSWNASVNAYVGSFYNAAELNYRINYPTSVLIYGELNVGIDSRDFLGTTFRIRDEHRSSSIIQNEFHVIGKVGFSVTKRSDISFSTAYYRVGNNYYNTDNFSSEDSPDRDIFNSFIGKTKYSYNILNDRFFPNKGTKFDIQVEYAMGEEDYLVGTTSLNPSFSKRPVDWLAVNTSLDHYFKISNVFSLAVVSELQLSTVKSWHNYMSSMLYANTYQPFDDVKLRFIDDNRGYNYFGLGLRAVFTLPASLMIRAEGHSIAHFHKVMEGVEQQVDIDKFLSANYMFNLSLIFRNNVAPISLNFSFYDSVEMPYAITFNIGYLLFNRSARD